MNHYKTEQEIEAVVAGFEQCTTAKEGFNHLSHLTVAVYYLRTLSNDESVAKMRGGLFRFLDHHGIDRAKYNEELTRNWFDLVRQAIQQTGPDHCLVTITNNVLDKLGDSRMVDRPAE